MKGCQCLTSGSHSCLAVWGDPTGHLSPSQSPFSAPSWLPSTLLQSTPPAHPHSATKTMKNVLFYVLFQVESARQSPAVNSRVLDSSRSAFVLALLGRGSDRNQKIKKMQKTDLVRESTSSPAAVTTYKLTTRVKLCSSRMPYVCTSLSLLTLGSSGSPVLIFCTTTAWHASIPGGSDALSSYTIRGGRLGSGINLKDRVGGGGGGALEAVQISVEKRVSSWQRTCHISLTPLIIWLHRP